MNMCHACLAAASAALAVCPMSRADRGAINTARDVTIAEPAQRAIIAYDGVHELLILQTDVQADQETEIVEFMPLPSKPTVSLAAADCFAALGRIVKEHNLRYVVQSKGRDTADQTARAIEVVATAQLGPHSVTVVEVHDAAGFVDWVRDFFAKNELGEPGLGPDLEAVVADYLARRVCYFAFDIVRLAPHKQTVQPLVYEFESDHLYYPLKVTNLYGGRGVIELFFILPRLMNGPRERITITPGRARREGWHEFGGFLRSSDALVPATKLTSLHTRLFKMLRGELGWLFAVRYEGPLYFDEDIWVGDWHDYTPERR